MPTDLDSFSIHHRKDGLKIFDKTQRMQLSLETFASTSVAVLVFSLVRRPPPEGGMSAAEKREESRRKAQEERAKREEDRKRMAEEKAKREAERKAAADAAKKKRKYKTTTCSLGHDGGKLARSETSPCEGALVQPAEWTDYPWTLLSLRPAHIRAPFPKNQFKFAQIRIEI